MTYSIKAIRAHAEANYNKDGWDFLVECWSDEDIAEAAGKARSDKAAIAKVKAALRPLAERREEVRAEADIDWREPVTVGAGVAEGFEAEQSEVMTAEQAGENLPAAAQAAIEGKAQVEQGKAKGTAALAVMTAGFACDEVAGRDWTFDIMVKGDVHTHVTCTGTNEFGNDDLAWKRNGEGAVSKVAQSAYKHGLCAAFFGLKSSVPAVWTMVSKAIPMARAIREEGMTAKIVDGALVLEGGSGERAEAMRAAKSLSALAKVAEGKTGTSRESHGNAKGEGDGEGEARIATPAEIMAIAARLVEGAAKGEEALSNTALSFARKIAKLIADNPEAFAED